MWPTTYPLSNKNGGRFASSSHGRADPHESLAYNSTLAAGSLPSPAKPGVTWHVAPAILVNLGIFLFWKQQLPTPQQRAEVLRSRKRLSGPNTLGC
ncbi:hypothetical protein VTN96DRAFT_3774 [Rasamsonia emersonii]